MEKKANSQPLGYLLGGLLPIVALVVIYLVAYPGQSLKAFLEILWIQKSFSRILSIAVFPNLGIFFIFIWTNRLRSAKGVLGATFIFAIIVFAIRLFF
jgi:hypothetical protein